MPRKPFFLLCLLSLVVADGSRAQVVVLQDTTRNGQNSQPNTWSARSSTGLTLMGTWTALPGPTSGTVVGTWTLVDAQGRTVADGAWSASKSPGEWSGAWRAVVSGDMADHVGTWNAGVNLKANAQFADLFEKAVQAIVGGDWRYGRSSGAWSIRAFK